MTTATSQQDRLHGEDTVAQMAVLIDRFSRLLSIMPGNSDPEDPEDRADERALLIGVGLFAIADQLQRVGDLLQAPLPDLDIPTGDDIEIAE
jgi:hypothetical protein